MVPDIGSAFLADSPALLFWSEREGLLVRTALVCGPV